MGQYWVGANTKAQQAQLDTYKEEMEALNTRWSHDTKVKSERILNVSLAAGKQAMGELLQQGAETMAGAVQARIDTMLSPLIAEVRQARKLALLNIVTALITLLASALSTWALIR